MKDVSAKPIAALRSANGHATPARNAIILVGDGMGAAHRFAGQLLLVGRRGRLTMDQLPVVGQMATLSVDPTSFVTDSAAAATALATGVKTVNGAVAIDPDGRPRTTLLEFAKRAGKAVGLVTTCQVTDATPAAFGAHVVHRSDQSEVARQYLHESNVDVILGGGAAWWLPEGAADPFGSEDPRLRTRGTAGNLVADAARRGYHSARDAASLAAAADDPTVHRVLGLFAAQEMFRQSATGEDDGYDPDVTLAEMTGAAIEVLSRNPEGFVLMVEESAIDRMAHRNNAALTIKGVLELDRAVQVALAFAERDPDTLVVVTADHETGGLAIAGSADTPYPYEPGGGLLDTLLAGEDGPFPVADEPFGFVVGWATTGHTAATVPVTATGPGAGRLGGFFENTRLFEVVAESLGLLEARSAGLRSSRAVG